MVLPRHGLHIPFAQARNKPLAKANEHAVSPIARPALSGSHPQEHLCWKYQALWPLELAQCLLDFFLQTLLIWLVELFHRVGHRVVWNLLEECIHRGEMELDWNGLDADFAETCLLERLLKDGRSCQRKGIGRLRGHRDIFRDKSQRYRQERMTVWC